MKNEPLDLAWAAGFIDADGTITIRRSAQSRPETGHPSISIQHQALVQVGQRDYPENRKAIEKLHSMFGGYRSKYKHSQEGRNDMVTWGVASQKAVSCIEQILPYLVIKKLNGEIVLDFQRNKILSQGGPSSTRRLPQEELRRREDCWNRIRELNKKGVVRL